MTDKDLGTAAGDIFTKAFTLGYETGREYVPVGGMALTAEQVEDVRTVVNNSPMEIYDAKERGLYYAAAARLRALFPATEPAEDAGEIGWYRTMTPEFAAKNFGFPDVTCWAAGNTFVASDEGKWLWDGTEWGFVVYPPAPAEPAEEETKAEAIEYYTAGRDSEGNIRLDRGRGELVALAKHVRGNVQFWHDLSDSAVHKRKYRAALDLIDRETSPVVPAPTETEGGVIEVPDGRGIEVGEALKQIAAAQMAEVARKAETGPWQRIEDVPVGVPFKDREGSGLVKLADSQFGYVDNYRETSKTLAEFAPFVAVAEEG